MSEIDITQMSEKFMASFWKMCEKQFREVPFNNIIMVTALIAVVIHVCLHIYTRKKETTIELYKELLMDLIVFYVLFLLHISFFSRPVLHEARVIQLKHLWLDKYINQNMTNLLNLLLYIPYSMLWTAVQKSQSLKKNALWTLVVCFATTLIIESAQYIWNRGYFELDDMEANMLGSLIGTIFVIICCRIGRAISVGREQKQ